MIQSLLTKETPEIIRFFRSIDSLSEMLDKQEEKLRPVLKNVTLRIVSLPNS
jgi:hypothetical protein